MAGAQQAEARPATALLRAGLAGVSVVSSSAAVEDNFISSFVCAESIFKLSYLMLLLTTTD